MGVRKWVRGDQVHIWSSGKKEWAKDGSIQEISLRDRVIDKTEVPAGSIRILYNGSSTFKWVPPRYFDQNIRWAGKPPFPKEKMGIVSKQTHGWFPTWHERYVEINQGYVQWWRDEVEAKSGQPYARGSINLNGAVVDQKGKSIFVKGISVAVDGSPEAGGTVMVHAFSVKTDEEAAEWTDALRAHVEYKNQEKMLDETPEDQREAKLQQMKKASLKSRMER